MTFNINSNINQYPQSLTGLSSSPLPTIDNEKIKQDLNNNAVVKKANSAIDKPIVTAGLVGGFWVLLATVVTRFNEACRGGKILDEAGKWTGKYDGKYENSILGRIEKFGEKAEDTKFFKSKAYQGFTAKYRGLKSWVNEKVINKSNILSSMFNTPSKPSVGPAKMMSTGTLGEVSAHATSFFDKYVMEHSELQGVVKLKTKNLAEYEKTINTPKVAEAIKKIKGLGFKDLEHYCEVMKDTHVKSSIEKIIETTGRKEVSETALYIGKSATNLAKEDSLISKIFGPKAGQWAKKLIGTEVAGSELHNKLRALNIAKEAPLSKALPKITMRLVESLTNGTAGGKFIIAMQAYFLADALKKAYHAPKGDKFQTFMEELVSGTAMYLTMPLAMSIIHKIGGLQYIGLNKETVEKFRKDLTLFNEKAENRLFKTVEEYAKEKPTLKTLKKENLSLFKRSIYKPFELVGKFVTVGLEGARKFLKPGSGKWIDAMKNNKTPFISGIVKNLGKLIENPKLILKKGLGFPVRFLIFGLAIAPPLSNLAVRLSHLFFGRPTKSLLDKEKPEEDKNKTAEKTAGAAPANTSLLPQIDKSQPNAETSATSPLIPPAVKPQLNVVTPATNSGLNGNLVNMSKPNPQHQNNYISPQTQENNKSKQEDKTTAPVRTYVPSTSGVQVQPTNVEPDKLSAVMQKADRVEQEAMKYLAGH